MKIHNSRVNLAFNKSIVQLLLVSLAAVLLLATFLAQAKNLLGQDTPANTESVDGGNTAVIFPTNQIANITNHTSTEINSTVPNGAVNGGVYVERDMIASNPISFTVGSSFVPSASGEATTWTTSFSGAITSDTTWNDDILITGDVTINAGVTLTITPGVTVFFAAGSDDTTSGVWTDRPELHAYGTLNAVGTEENPIYFTSNAVTKAAGDWGGIVILKNSTQSTLTNCVVQYAEQGVRFWSNTTGTGILGGTVNQCTISDNTTGIYLISNPPNWAAYTLTVDPTIKNNHIVDNVDYGIYMLQRTGYETVNFNSTVENNHIDHNGTGIYMTAHSWWEGSLDVRTTIRNNTIENNATTGLYVRAVGSSDSSGSDTDVQSLIEHNLIRNNPTNLHLHLNPYGSDGIQILMPTIRYNTIQNGNDGILISDDQPYDTLNPTIMNNVFLGFDDVGEVEINNTTGRTIVANDNYWGDNDTAWDAGPQPGDTSGTVTVNSFLTSASAPVLTRLASATGQPGDSVTLYGANFGETHLDYVFLPLIIDNPQATHFNPIFIGNAIPQRDVNLPGEVFYTTNIRIPTELPSTGNFYLSAQSGALTETLVDDEIVFDTGNSIVYTHDYAAGGTPQPGIVPIPRVTIENLAGQTIMVEYHDIYGIKIEASEMWLIWVP